MASHLLLFCVYALTLGSMTDASLFLDIQPGTISPDSTHSLLVNCTFSYDSLSDVSNILSLVISKDVLQTRDNPRFQDIVSLQVFNPDQVIYLQYRVQATASGHVSTRENSYLSLLWASATKDEIGLYKCQLHGMDKSGRCVTLSYTNQVLSDVPDLDQVTKTPYRPSKIPSQLAGQVKNQRNKPASDGPEQAEIHNQDDSLHLAAIPKEISSPLTKDLLVNCSFNYDAAPDLSTVLSFSISKTAGQNQRPQDTVELVSLNALDDDRVSILSEIYNASVSGHVGTGDDAYLSLQWSYPSGVQAGLYQCEVRGMDDTGHIMVITSKTAKVIANQPDLSELIDKIGDLQKELERQQQTQSQCCISLQAQYDRMEKNHTETTAILQGELSNLKDQNRYLQHQNINLTTMITSLHVTADRLWNIAVEKNYHKSEIYDNHYYLLSKQSWNDASVVEGVCESFGGYLAEIDNAGENTFIIDFVDQFSDVTAVLLGGTDEASEGIWMFRYSNTPVVFTNWNSGEPGEAQKDCMLIYRGYSWKMYDEYCKYNYGANVRYLCEIPMQ